MQTSGDVTTVATVYGAILLGTCIACGLTGVVLVQCIMYYKLYPGDFAWTKILVFVVWAFDLMHTICIVIAVWECVITNFNSPQSMDHIPSTLGLSVAITAAITFMVHCFFANRIRMLTKKWYIAAPVVFLAFLRLFSACVSTGEIIRLKRYSLFIKPYPSWVFTMGVTLSASVEVIITTVMVAFLGSRRTGFENMNHIINTLILFTLETGSVTCLVTISSLICWVVMRHNLIFLGMHFAIAKLYANSLLATLNARKRLRTDYMNSNEREMNHALSPLRDSTKTRFSSRNRKVNANGTQKSVQLNVNVETITISRIDDHKEQDDVESPPGDPESLDAFGPGLESRYDVTADRHKEDRKYPNLV